MSDVSALHACDLSVLGPEKRAMHFSALFYLVDNGIKKETNFVNFFCSGIYANLNTATKLIVYKCRYF